MKNMGGCIPGHRFVTGYHLKSRGVPPGIEFAGDGGMIKYGRPSDRPPVRPSDRPADDVYIWLHGYMGDPTPHENHDLFDFGTLIFPYKSTIWIENLNSAWSNYPEKSWRNLCS